MNIEEMLHTEIASEFKKLEAYEAGTPEHKAVVDEIAKLTDRAIEMEKIGANATEKDKDRDLETKLKTAQRELEEKFKAKELELDEQFKMKQLEDDRKDRLIKNCMSAAGIIIPVIATVWGTLKTLEFEKEGTVTTIMGRGFINKLLPKK